MKFFKDSPIYITMLFVFAFIGFVASCLFIYDHFFGSDIIFKSDKRPNFVVEGNPQISLSFKIDLPLFPDIIQYFDTTKQIVDSSKLESIVFDVFENKAKEKIELQPMENINFDSMFNNKRSQDIGNIVPRFKIGFKIKNYGESTGKFLIMATCDTTSFEPILRNKLLAENSLPAQTYFGHFDPKEVHELMHDSSIIFRPTGGDITPHFVDNNKNFILHLYILYCDAKGNFYDSYYWVQYHLVDFDFYIEPIQTYIRQDNGKFIADKIIFHYYPRKPKPEELFQQKEIRYDYERELTKKEIKNIKNLIGDKYKLE